MGARISIEGAECVTPAPIIILARHISIGDALLPTAVVGDKPDLYLRHVAKNDMLWDPAIDIVGNQMINFFVDRAPVDNSSELTPIRDLAATLGPDAAAVIFPEGTFRTPERHERAIARLRQSNLEAAELAATFNHVLPPRPAGTIALLEGHPEADIVVFSHIGFEPFSSLRQIWENTPLTSPIQIGLWRIPRSEVPDTPEAQRQWLLEVFKTVDNWVEDRWTSRVPSPA